MTKIILLILYYLSLPYTSFATTNVGYENDIFINKIKNLQIRAVAPASSVDSVIIENISKIPAIEINKHYFKNNTHPFHSNDIAARFKDFCNAIYSENTNILWAVRGGSGAAELIPLLQALPKPKIKKTLIGYSDITALNIFVSDHWGWQAIHGAMLNEIFNEHKDAKNLTMIADIINNIKNQVIIEDIEALNTSAENSTEIIAKITGGNLEIIRTSIGTEWQISTKNKILFLEDVNIQGYQLDRSLQHLLQAKILTETSAIILGSFTKDTKDDLSIRFAINNFAEKTTIPVFKSNKIGHDKINYPIIYNTNATILKIQNSKDIKIYKLIMNNNQSNKLN